jgi:hypothetical protein
MAGENNNEDLDLDLDLDDQDGNEGNDQIVDNTDKVLVGDQADGAYVVELKDGEDDKTKNEGDGAEGNDADAALEAKRAARREERAEQKRKRHERDQRQARELASERKARQELETRLAVIERRAEGGEAAQIDEGIKQAAQAYNYQKQRQIAALEAGNATEAADAIEKMMTSRQKHDQLTNVKAAYEQRQRTPAPLDARLKTNAAAFMERNAWYKAEGNDTDSSVTRALDNALVSEGFDPRTEEYWDELQSRVKKYLPHRVAGGKVVASDTSGQVATKPKSVVSGSGRDSAASVGAKATFKLSADRVQAMKEAGIWDDPKQREESIKRYRAFDKTNGKG